MTVSLKTVNSPKASAVMQLTDVTPGNSARFVSTDLSTGPALQSRLAAMGLLPGVPIEIIRNSPKGPFVVLVRGAKLMLGRAMAERIRVA